MNVNTLNIHTYLVRHAALSGWMFQPHEALQVHLYTCTTTQLGEKDKISSVCYS